MALISSWSTWKHGLLHVPDHKGCSLCLCFLSVLAAEGGCYFLTCEFYKNITRILNLVRRGRAMKSDVVQLFCGAYLEMSHKMLSENGKLYPPTNSSILNSGYYIKSKMNERKVKIFAQESSEMWLQTVMGSSLIYRSNPCPMSSWWMKRHLQRVNHFTLRQVSQTAEIPPCGVHTFPPLTQKGTGLAATNPAVTVVKESLLHRFSVVLPFVFSPISLQLASYSKATT